MDQGVRSSRLVPAGFAADRIEIADGSVRVRVRSRAAAGTCPACGACSRRVQSRYWRQAADLPMAGRRVTLRIMVRHFWCDAVLCGRRVFAERFGDDVLAPRSRRTGRLEVIVHHLGLALGGRPAASFAERLMVPVSNDTLLREVRHKTQMPAVVLTVIGIDDFAWRRNHRYGTIICDLERRRTVTLLPDREPATSEAWLRHHPSIAIVARDRGGGYGEATARALPKAEQVADRWHLMENASRGFLDAVRKSMRQIRSVVGATVINPELLTAAERLRYEGYLRREETNTAVMALFKDGMPIKRIVKRTGLARDTVRRIVRSERSDVFRTRQSSLDELLPWLNAQWDAGKRNASALWRTMRSQGFRGSLRVVSEWATRRRRAEKADADTLTRVPSARTIARLMTSGRDRLSKADTVIVAAIENGLPELVSARELIADFHQMIRARAIGAMTPWLERATDSLVASFGAGVSRDEAAVRGAIVSPWSNGQTEGQITKLKLVKRQMYGRGKIDLLQARLIGASPC